MSNIALAQVTLCVWEWYSMLPVVVLSNKFHCVSLLEGKQKWVLVLVTDIDY